MTTIRSKRPVYLNLLRIRQPVGAVVSIAHRVTGVLLVLALPPAVWILQLSLRDEQGFRHAAGLLAQPLGRALVLALFACFALHFFAGLRHLLLDIDVGIARSSARRSAWLVWAATATAVAVCGAALL